MIPLQEMRDELKAMGLSIKGNKPELTKRLEEAISKGQSQENSAAEPEAAPETATEEAQVRVPLSVFRDHQSDWRYF